MRTVETFIVAFACLIAGSASPSYAFSGAEFLSSDRSFSKGYAFGALEYRLSVGSEADWNAMGAAKECFSQAGINSDSFYEAVRTYLENNLSALTEPAIGAILRTSLEMCPWGE